MLVPDAEVFTSRIVNNTADPVRRGSIGVWLGYDTDLRAAVAAFESVGGSAKGVLPEPPPIIRLDDLGVDDLKIEVSFSAESRRSDFENTSSTVREAILTAFKAARIPLPDPNVRIVTMRPPPSSSPLAAH